MTRVLLILAPGRSVRCVTTHEARDVLRLATGAGLVASIAPDGLTVRCEPLDRAAAPGLIEAQLASERAAVAELHRQLLDEQRARGAAVQRAEDAERRLRQRGTVEPSLYDHGGETWGAA